MLVYKVWYNSKKCPVYNAKYRYKGLFLFGFIPLYIHRSIVSTNSYE